MAVVLLAACGGNVAVKQSSAATPSPLAQSPTLPTASGSPMPAPACAPPNRGFGVFAGSSQDAAGHYTIRIVGSDTRTAASYVAAAGGDEIPPPLHQASLPRFSLSDAAVYFPDGDEELRALCTDGRTAVVHTLPNMPGKSRAVFAVSPDDSRIAMAIFDWSVSPMSEHLYVEDLNGGSHHVDLNSSTSEYEWPIGWHAGNLVIAAGPFGGGSNPYGAGSYHVASASAATRLAVMGGPDCLVVGPLSAAGTACASICSATVTCVDAVDWSGARTVIYRRPNSEGSGASWSALSPNGTMVTTGAADAWDGVANESGVLPLMSNTDSFTYWWVDDGHLLGLWCIGASRASCSDKFALIDIRADSAIALVDFDPSTWPVGWLAGS
jgi:hypothetical protein